MIKVYSEDSERSFTGTIIDLETIGNFKKYKDSRVYSEITPVIFGFINDDGIQIHYAINMESIEELKNEMKQILSPLESKKPFYAFNTDFERGVLFHSLNLDVEFEGELNTWPFEAKKSAVKELEIPNYDDPFNDDGLKCKEAWLEGEIDKAIAHNRSCLLKERQILLNRGFRPPEELDMIKIQ